MPPTCGPAGAAACGVRRVRPDLHPVPPAPAPTIQVNDPSDPGRPFDRPHGGRRTAGVRPVRPGRRRRRPSAAGSGGAGLGRRRWLAARPRTAGPLTTTRRTTRDSTCSDPRGTNPTSVQTWGFSRPRTSPNPNGETRIPPARPRQGAPRWPPSPRITGFQIAGRFRQAQTTKGAPDRSHRLHPQPHQIANAARANVAAPGKQAMRTCSAARQRRPAVLLVATTGAWLVLGGGDPIVRLQRVVANRGFAPARTVGRSGLGSPPPTTSAVADVRAVSGLRPADPGRSGHPICQPQRHRPGQPANRLRSSALTRTRGVTRRTAPSTSAFGDITLGSKTPPDRHGHGVVNTGTAAIATVTSVSGDGGGARQRQRRHQRGHPATTAQHHRAGR